jgi:anaerobic magnesium-protoporphyrin IX monomethyl ester cyclase
MAKVLLINPSMADIYTKAKVKSSVPQYFPLNLLTIAPPLLEKNHEVQLLDLNLHEDPKNILKKQLSSFKPDYVGITFTTPLYSQSLEIASLAKTYNKNTIVIAGGVHITSDCLNTLKNSKIDVGVLGEGDWKLLEIVESKNLDKIKGIGYKKNGEVIMNDRELPLRNLDEIPFPATSLINIKNYKTPYTYCKANPVFPLETSRGCVYGCIYCNKSIFGRTFRIKSIDRVMEDLRKIQKMGYKEVHIIDDGFTTDINRAKKICRLILKEKIKLNFNCPNGIELIE